MSHEKDTVCGTCGSAEEGACMLLCDACDAGYHMRCLSPELFEIPEGDWYCVSCTDHRTRVTGKTKTLTKKAENAKIAVAEEAPDDDAHILTDHLERELTKESLEDLFVQREILPASVRLERAVNDVIAERGNAELERITALMDKSFQRFLKDFSTAAETMKRELEYMKKQC